MSITAVNTTPPSLPQICALTNLPFYSRKTADEAVALCWQEVNKAHQMIAGCPFSKALWEEMHAQGPFSIDCLPAEELRHPAAVDIKTRAITISTFDHQDMKHSLLFELNNLKQSKAFAASKINACSKDSVKYAKTQETIEFKTLTDTDQIFRQCIEQQFWTPDNAAALLLPENVKLDAEIAWEVAIKTGHASFYQLQWYQSCAPDQVDSFKLLLRMLTPEIPLPPNFYWDNDGCDKPIHGLVDLMEGNAPCKKDKPTQIPMATEEIEEAVSKNEPDKISASQDFQVLEQINSLVSWIKGLTSLIWD